MTLIAIDSDTIAVRPWADASTAPAGFDPRTSYVEGFWLALIGPSTTWLLRHIAARLDASPAGFDMSLAQTARALGLGDKAGRNSAFFRTLNRMAVFDLARQVGPGQLEVARRLPPLSRRQIAHLPTELQQAHEEWLAAHSQLPPAEAARRRSRQLALSLLELGEEAEEVERQLLRWRYHPALASEAVAWALDRHRHACAVAAAG